MAYNLGWGSNHPGHFVYLVDLSQSMNSDNKIDAVIRALGQVSEHLIGQCDTFSGLKNRFSITILGYNSDVYELFSGSIIDLDKRLAETGEPMFDKEKEALPRWQTYTAKALRAAAKDIREWIAKQNQNNVPIPVPVVIHITDGHPEEHERNDSESIKDALAAAQELKSISVPDGNTLLCNIHIDGVKSTETLLFPSIRPSDTYRQFLFDSSSTMPDIFSNKANSSGFSTTTNSRLMASNVSNPRDLLKVIKFYSSVPKNSGNRESPKI